MMYGTYISHTNTGTTRICKALGSVPSLLLATTETGCSKLDYRFRAARLERKRTQELMCAARAARTGTATEAHVCTSVCAIMITYMCILCHDACAARGSRSGVQRPCRVTCG